MKHLIHTIMLMLGLMLPTTALAYDLEADGIYYNINGQNATVTSGPIYYSGDVVIPAAVTHNDKTVNVTAIGNSAFRNCTGLTSITIPNTVTEVGEHAFAGCTELDSVDIGDIAAWCRIEFASSLSNPCYFAHRLFLDGQEITQVAIPDTVTAIGSHVFSGCWALNKVTIPSTVNTIGVSAFSNCPSLTSIIVADDNPTFDSRDGCNAIIDSATGTLIAGCQATTIPATVKAIAAWAFYECTTLTGINIPNSVTSIGMEAFYRCTSLMGVIIPNSVTTIGFQAFYHCSELRGIHIPQSVRSIGTSALEFCPALSSITVADGNPRYDSRDGCNAIIETATGTLIAGCRNTVIPTTVTAIGDYAFSGASALHSADMPISVKEIGDYAFRGCHALASATLPDSLTAIGSSAFFECSSLKGINIPATVTRIGPFAFEHCPALAQITVASDNPIYDSRKRCNAIIETATNTLQAGCMNTVIPGTVARIGDNAFSGSHMLTEVYIPKSVTVIGDFAFAGCSSLASVNIPNSVISIGYAAFSECSALTSLDIPNSVVSIGQAAFGGCVSLTSVSLPKSVTAIGDYEFHGCAQLTSVIIPKTVTAIGQAAFEGCLSLENISLPATVTTIGASAFRGCSALKRVNIPYGVATIGSNAFRNCASLTSVTIPSTVAGIGHTVFSGCSSLSTIIVVNDNPVYDSRQRCDAIIERATNRLIAGCKSTVIPSSVNAIGYAAFEGCNDLTQISIPQSVTAIEKKAFHDCPALKDVTSHIADPTRVTVAADAFKLPSGKYTERSLHVPFNKADAYRAIPAWSEHFGTIDETIPQR